MRFPLPHSKLRLPLALAIALLATASSPAADVPSSPQEAAVQTNGTIPEPAAAALGLVGLGLILFRRFRTAR